MGKIQVRQHKIHWDPRVTGRQYLWGSNFQIYHVWEVTSAGECMYLPLEAWRDSAKRGPNKNKPRHVFIKIMKTIDIVYWKHQGIKKSHTEI